jgi:integrase/recombinase XerC
MVTTLSSAVDPQILPISPSLPAAVLATALNLERAVLAGRKATTIRAYQSDFNDFALFMEQPSGAQALDELVRLPKRLAVSSVIAYRASLVDRKLSPSTINRRLSALRTACRLAKSLCGIDWDLDVEGIRAQSYRDTRGPGDAAWKAVLDRAKQLAAGDQVLGRRNLAILRILRNPALRREEVCMLDLEDLDLKRGIVMVLGKGRSDKAPITLPPHTRASLADFVALRGTAPGPLFSRLDRAGTGGRLTGRAVWKLVRKLGADAALSRPLRPHGLRHSGITKVLEVSGGDVRAARQFSRHAKVETLMVYDDNRADIGGVLASAIDDE